MVKGTGFDNEKYLREQTEKILERAGTFGNKLYLEFGGKLISDFHAARVLPGYDPNVKMRLLHQLKDKTDILLCIHAGAIEKKKIRADFGITYDADALKLIDDLRGWDLSVLAVVVTRFNGQPAAVQFVNRLKRRGVRVYTHRPISGYPSDINLITSDEGYGANDYIETGKPVVVVTAPGPGSGKMGTCLSQLYHDHKKGIQCGYAKFETFPIWNLPLKHPVNLAYEAATADIGDYNLIDPHHAEAHGQSAVNYNRDVDAFPLLRTILERIMGNGGMYGSPTDMGVNCAGFAITDDQLVRRASVQEVIRRYFRYGCEYAMGLADRETVERLERLLNELHITPSERMVVVPARMAAESARRKNKGNEGVYCGAAIELPDGSIATGENSPLMHAASAAVFNAIKALAGIPDKLHLLAPGIIESVGGLKKNILGTRQLSLDLEETLIALSISATSNPGAQLAMEKLKDLRGAEMHMTHIPTPGDEAGLRRLGVNLTTDPNFSSKDLFIT